jgi:hypothetical protein
VSSSALDPEERQCHLLQQASRGSGLGRATCGDLAVGSRGAAAPPHPVASAAARDGRSRALVQGARLAGEVTVVGRGSAPGGGEALMLEVGEGGNCRDLGISNLRSNRRRKLIRDSCGARGTEIGLHRQGGDSSAAEYGPSMVNARSTTDKQLG